MLALEPWRFVERGNPTGAPFSGREAMIGLTLVACAAAAFVPRASRWVLVALVGGMLTFTASLAWAHAREAARSLDASAFSAQAARSWVDEALPTQRPVLLLTTPGGCRALEDSAARLTEFFNDAVGPGASVGPPDRLAPPSERAVWRAGVLTSERSGRPIAAEGVLVRDGVELVGTRVTTGTRAPLVLWKVSGVVRLAGPVRDLGCPGS
jgi:hypothetical protein